MYNIIKDKSVLVKNIFYKIRKPYNIYKTAKNVIFL